MRWLGGRESANVEDRRGVSGGGLAVGGGIGTMVIAVIIYLLGGNPNAVLNNAPQQQTQTEQAVPANDQTTKFVRTILGSTEDVWGQVLPQQANIQYTDPTLVLFNEVTQSACGSASQATGPFYCPGDSKVYLDVSFFNELADRFGAPGEFASAYVIAHEIGHHVQHLLGTTDKIDAQRGRISEKDQNALSVRLELQADFYAGVWSHYVAQQKDKGSSTGIVIGQDDIEAALNAANAIGDDRLQKESQGTVVPDAFTHGTSAQRMKWFKKGYETGDLKQGNTFTTDDL